MSDLLAFVADCWLPLVITLAAGLTLYRLGRAEGRYLERRRRGWRHQRLLH